MLLQGGQWSTVTHSDLNCLQRLIIYAQNRKIGKPNNSKVFGSNKTQGPKQDSQNWLRSPMPVGG